MGATVISCHMFLPLPPSEHALIKVAYDANENPFKKILKKIVYVSQRLMYSIIKNMYIAKITNPITKPRFLIIIKLTYTGIK